MKRGFTILEILLALALAAVMMVGILAVIRSLGRSAEAMRGSSEAPAWQSHLQALIREDLHQAELIEISIPQQLRLRGYMALNRATFEREHRLADVVYELIEAGDGYALIRQQTLLGGISNLDVSREVVCAELRGFDARWIERKQDLEAPDEAESIASEAETRTAEGDDATSPEPPPADDAPPPWLAMPVQRELLMTLMWKDLSRPSWEAKFLVW